MARTRCISALLFLTKLCPSIKQQETQEQSIVRVAVDLDHPLYALSGCQMCRYSVPQRMSFRRRTERRRLRSFLRSFPSVAFTKTGDPIIRPVNARSRSKRSSSRRARMVSKSSAARGRATIPPLFIGSLEFAQIRSRFRRLYPRNGLFGIAPFDVLLCDPF